MPNNTSNTLKVTRGKDIIKNIFKAKKAFSDEIVDFTFNGLIRMEDHLDDPDYQNATNLLPMDEKYKNFDWYNWSIEYWGTKWDAYDVFVHETDDSIEYEFLTAWSAPIPIYLELIDRFGHDIDFEVEFAYEFEDDICRLEYKDGRNDFQLLQQ